MFRWFEPERHQVPLWIWLNDRSELDETCRMQADNLACLPLAYHHVALMPDTHGGFGMPIGGVLACEDVIIPNAVGVDIGCGVAFARTDLPASVLEQVQTARGLLGRAVAGEIMRSVPTGFQHQDRRQASAVLDAAKKNLPQKEGLPDLEEGYYQLGTLGGGNHFIELQEDQDGLLAIMVHSGSRNFGYKTARYFNQVAKDQRKTFSLPIPPEYDLAGLPTESREGQMYVQWLKLCLQFAAENRKLMLERVVQIVLSEIRSHLDKPGSVTLEIHAHHNYAAQEEHFGRRVWVHRKGAIEANAGQWGIIPGAMGSYSYITKGLGEPLSFRSSSHGAGRAMGRKEALRRFSRDEVMQDLNRQGIVLGKVKKKDTAEEYRLAYKDIEEVMAQQRDLAEIVLRLRTKVVIKG